ncbi:hypothetical protein F5Y12DRAFT_792393 [Xylaria sp. FL1777]|nr:hypothetical protein F5Y12DRAFT_792393 [Xylaria sp. FL1777]
MDSAGLRSVGASIKGLSDSAQKRKAFGDQGVNNSSRKKQKGETSFPLARAGAKKSVQSKDTMDTSIDPDSDDTPESASPTLSTAPLALPAGQPPIFSNLRAALCDSIDFWKSHQGSIQSINNVATGMLLNGKTTPRDILQSQVIVTTTGGGLKIGPDGKHIRIEDQQDTCKNYVCLKNAMEIGRPVGIVIGKQHGDKGHYANNLLNIKLEYHYNVLDWFFVTDIWSEPQPTQPDGTSFIQYAVRLQKIDLTSTSWWMPQGEEKSNMYAVGQFHFRTSACESCHTESKEIFKEGWCCLKKTCREFFRFSGLAVDINSLRYNEDFLNERRVWTSKIPLPDLIPALPSLEPKKYGSESCYKRGIICPTCKTPIRRISWQGWTCENSCGFKLSMPPKDVDMERIHSETLAVLNKRTKFYEVDDRIARVNHTVAGYEVTSFYFPNTPKNLDEARFIGSVTIFRSKESTLERKGGLNDLFQEIQEATRKGDVELRRHPAFCRGSHMEELTSHFSCNMGADYKFGVAVETSSGFENAPAPVMKALSRLTWAGATAVGLTADHVTKNGLSIDSSSMPDNFVDFNEQLMLGYFLNSQISFHDDGEKELGPTVATLSLGSPSKMQFRGKKNSGFENTIGEKGVMLSFVLEHGDIVIMHGTKIHQHYEHAVSAAGVRRYALTCRYIRPDMIQDPERRQKAIMNGKVPIYWQKQAYAGESAQVLDQLSHQPDAGSS